MGGCDIEQMIITPDGQIFPFVGPRIKVGAPERDWGLEGDGMPPIEHYLQDLYSMPGALYKGMAVKPRTVTLTTTTHGVTETALRDIKARMHGAFRWDRGEPGEPSIYRHIINGTPRDLYVYYDGDVEQVLGPAGLVRTVGARFLAVDPFFYDPATQEQVLFHGETFSMRLVMRRVAGEWDNMGPPTAAAAGAGGTTSIHAITGSPDGAYVYFGGDFQNFHNIAAADHIVRWNVATSTWEAVGGGLNHVVRCLYFGPDGTLYAGGFFTNGSGGAGDAAADYIAQYSAVTDTWINVGGGPGAGVVTMVNAILVGADGTLYLGGQFTNWNGIAAADYIVSLPLPYAGGAWAALGAAALDNSVYSLVMLPNARIAVGGLFTAIGANPYLRVAEWDPVGTAWATIGAGFNNDVRCLAVGLDGTLYAGGWFASSGGVAMLGVAQYNGTLWMPMGDGLDDPVQRQIIKLFVHPNGDIYASGVFVNAGGLAFADYIAKWNGSAWSALDIALPAPVATATRFCFAASGALYLGTDHVGNITTSGQNSVVNAGNAFTHPVIEIKNQGTLGVISNVMMDQEIEGNLDMLDGEIVTIDLNAGVKSCESNWRGNRLGDILPASDMATFCLESDPRAAYGGVEGANLITVFITDAIPRESGDNNNQLSGWGNITGISQDNTDLGRLYVNIVADGGGFYHVDLYMDPAKAAGDLVAHTATYNGVGAKAIVADNASGLGGMITVDAVVGADTNIQVWFTIVTMSWRNRWWDLDTAVS